MNIICIFYDFISEKLMLALSVIDYASNFLSLARYIYTQMRSRGRYISDAHFLYSPTSSLTSISVILASRNLIFKSTRA